MTEARQIRVLVADDEPLARRGVRQLLTAHPDMRVAGESRNGPETLRALEALQPDLLFLDIQMPEMSGFEVLRARGPARMPAVIFVTAHDQFAVRAFEAQALDYLVKPLSVARFDSALERVRERLQMAEAVERAARLTALLEAERTQGVASRVKRLVIPTDSGELLLSVEEIDWIEAENYYVCVHTNSKQYILRESMASLEARLDGTGFARVHRSAIVRLDRVREVRATSQGDELILQNDVRVPVSRRKRGRLADLLANPDGT
jgi:two-component system LytT family response regulator